VGRRLAAAAVAHAIHAEGKDCSIVCSVSKHQSRVCI